MLTPEEKKEKKKWSNKQYQDEHKLEVALKHKLYMRAYRRRMTAKRRAFYKEHGDIDFNSKEV